MVESFSWDLVSAVTLNLDIGIKLFRGNCLCPTGYAAIDSVMPLIIG